MTEVIRFDPWAGRLTPGTPVRHARYGVCHVTEAHGLWRTVQTVAYELADEPGALDPLAGERAVPIERRLSVFELQALDPLADLRPAPPGELIALESRRARP